MWKSLRRRACHGCVSLRSSLATLLTLFTLADPRSTLETGPVDLAALSGLYDFAPLDWEVTSALFFFAVGCGLWAMRRFQGCPQEVAVTSFPGLRVTLTRFCEPRCELLLSCVGWATFKIHKLLISKTHELITSSLKKTSSRKWLMSYFWHISF